MIFAGTREADFGVVGARVVGKGGAAVIDDDGVWRGYLDDFAGEGDVDSALLFVNGCVAKGSKDVRVGWAILGWVARAKTERRLYRHS